MLGVHIRWLDFHYHVSSIWLVFEKYYTAPLYLKFPCTAFFIMSRNGKQLHFSRNFHIQWMCYKYCFVFNASLCILIWMQRISMVKGWKKEWMVLVYYMCVCVSMGEYSKITIARALIVDMTFLSTVETHKKVKSALFFIFIFAHASCSHYNLGRK